MTQLPRVSETSRRCASSVRGRRLTDQGPPTVLRRVGFSDSLLLAHVESPPRIPGRPSGNRSKRRGSGRDGVGDFEGH